MNQTIAKLDMAPSRQQKRGISGHRVFTLVRQYREKRCFGGNSDRSELCEPRSDNIDVPGGISDDKGL